ncbi:uncharacterized protein KY384_000116 [Bacidia gigantensis]|uniref:uncharacterized protein n=1 Tax=Bacidia gigantensis TaxID=2732470 RepID=UPI001D03CF8F|nr:uncharacterized protein KY384_000116 [Bacidia gigantensis]KAG8526123.1 hypothetical protein KY384_000116 [Bacidia gigantensis]
MLVIIRHDPAGGNAAVRVGGAVQKGVGGAVGAEAVDVLIGAVGGDEGGHGVEGGAGSVRLEHGVDAADPGLGLVVVEFCEEVGGGDVAEAVVFGEDGARQGVGDVVGS